MKIGELNKRIHLQYKTQTTDGMGGFTDTWVSAGMVWAAIWPISVNDIIKSDSLEFAATHQIRMRYRNDIKASWRILYGQRYFSIVSPVNPEERNEWLYLICKEDV